MTKPLWFLTGIFVSAAAAEPSAHKGPVTDIVFNRSAEEIYSCSQSGIFRGHGASLEPVHRSEFRVISMAIESDALFLSGGEPGESGKTAIFDLDFGRMGAKQWADDLVYSMVLCGETAYMALATGKVIGLRKGSIFPGHEHTAAARAVDCSPDGQFLASGGMDRLVILAELTQARTRIAIQDHTGPVDCLSFSPDSTRLASGARDGKVRIHSAANGKLVRTYSGLDGEVSAIVWGGKPEQLLAGTSKGKFYRLDLSNDSSEIVADWGGDSPITALAIAPGGKIFGGTLNRIDQVNFSD